MKQHSSPLRLKQHWLQFLCLFTATLFMLNAKAQTNSNNKPVYISFTYLKTAPGKYNDYVNLAKTASKKVQEYQVQQGTQLGWYLYEVLTPTGTQADYNFVGVNVNTDLQQLLDPVTSMREVFQKAAQINGQQADSIMQAMGMARSVVKRDIFLERSSTNESGPPTKYAEIDFMTPVQGKNADYAKMEIDKFLPVHKQRMAMGALKGWRLAQKVMPSATDEPYSYVTANFYESIDMMLQGKYPEAIKKAWPTQDMTKLFQTINTVKKEQRNE
ncbi:MAG: hypothetical protein ABIN89_09945, partial [Chitinophagaceae bacterium]